MKSASYPQTLRFFMLQPGDATRYTIGMGHLDPGAQHVIPGVGTTDHSADRFVMLVIISPFRSGVTIINAQNVKRPHSFDVDYTMGHGLDKCDPYTVAAALLAASVLLDDPTNIEAAHAAMLKAPELFI